MRGGTILTEKSNGTQGKESQGRSEVLTAVDNDNIVVRVLADGGLGPGDNLEGVVAQARGVGNLAVVNDIAGLIAALLVDGGALDTALLGGTLLASVGLGAGLGGRRADNHLAVLTLVVTTLGTSRVAVLADSRLNPGDDVEGVVAEAGGVLNLAVIDDIASSIAASLVRGCASHAALLRGSRRLLGRGANNDLAILALVVAALCGGRVRLITVLARGRLLPRDNVPGVVAQADGVLGLAVLDDGTVGGAARVVDSGALEAALLRGSGRLRVLGLVMLAHGGLNPGDNVKGVITQASGVLDLAVVNDISRSVAAGLVGGCASDTADLGGLGLLRAGDGGHALRASSGLNKASAGIGVMAETLGVVGSASSLVSTGGSAASVVLLVAVLQTMVDGRIHGRTLLEAAMQDGVALLTSAVGDALLIVGVADSLAASVVGRHRLGSRGSGNGLGGGDGADIGAGSRVDDGLNGLGSLGQSTRAEGDGHETGEGERVSHLDGVVFVFVLSGKE